jgi:biopolymer transport protein ExbB
MGNIAQFIKENFWHVMPILVAAVLAIAIVMERLRALFVTYPMHDRKQFFDRLRGYIMADRLMDAIALCNVYESKPMAQVVREGLIRGHQPEEMVADGLALAVSEASQRITQRTAYLATIANVATLLGLFGTIAGLIQSFEAVGSANASEKSALLAAGISTAMNATMLGLGVAIPCMVAFSFLMNRTNRMSAELDQAAIRTMDLLRQRYYNDGKEDVKRSADQRYVS